MKELIEIDNPKIPNDREINNPITEAERFRELKQEYDLLTEKKEQLRQEILKLQEEQKRLVDSLLATPLNAKLLPYKQDQIDKLINESAEMEKQLVLIHQQMTEAHRNSQVYVIKLPSKIPPEDLAMIREQQKLLEQQILTEKIKHPEIIPPEDIEKDIHPGDPYYPNIEN